MSTHIATSQASTARRLLDIAGTTHAEPNAIARRLRAVPKLGPVGVHIFFRELQQVWPELRPYIDKKAASGAEKLGLPTDPAELAKLVPDSDIARFSAALVRVTLERDVADRVLGGPGT